MMTEPTRIPKTAESQARLSAVSALVAPFITSEAQAFELAEAVAAFAEQAIADAERAARAERREDGLREGDCMETCPLNEDGHRFTDHDYRPFRAALAAATPPAAPEESPR